MEAKLTKILEAEVVGLAGSHRVHRFHLDRELNVFWGLNGSGKTSFLRILDSALNNDASSILDVAFESARIVFLSESYNATLERTIHREAWAQRPSAPRSGAYPDMRTAHDLNDLAEEAQRRGESWQTKLLEGDADLDYGIPYQRTFLPISRLNDVQLRRYARYGNASPSFDIEEFDFEADIESAWRQYNSVSLETIREIQQKGLADILSVLFQSTLEAFEGDAPHSVDADGAYNLVLDFLVQQGMNLDLDRRAFVQRYHTRRELQSVVRRIRDVNEEIEKTTRSQRAFKETVEGLYSGEKRILFTKYSTIEVQTGGRRSMSVDRLSSGEKQILRILLATLAGQTSPVLIDEPELSLHIDWQRQLVSAMRAVNPDCQLILATHSPEVVARVPEHQIFEL